MVAGQNVVKDQYGCTVPFISKWLGLVDDDGTCTKHKDVNYQTGQYYRAMACIPRGTKLPDGSTQLMAAGEDNPDAKFYRLDISEGDLGDFGLGIGLYFDTLKKMAILMFLLGLLNIPNVVYFSSEEYSGNEQGNFDITEWIQGSAYCPESMSKIVSRAKKVAGEWVITDQDLTKHTCNFSEQLGVIDLIGVFIFVAAAIYMGYNHQNLANEIDEAVQTSQDYSVVVQDPGDDDRNPDEWKEFFQKHLPVTDNGEQLYKDDVVAVTIAVKNGKLMDLLVQRKALLKKLNSEGWTNEGDVDFCENRFRDSLINGTPLDFSDEIAGHPKPGPIKTIMLKLGLTSDITVYVSALNTVNEEIKVTFILMEKQRVFNPPDCCGLHLPE